MKTDGLFIEYLIIGGISICWILPLFHIINFPLEDLDIDAKVILVGLPITYIIGMIMDYYAAAILRKNKNEIKDKFFKMHNIPPLRQYEFFFIITNFNKDLMKYLEMRDSRVRTVRGLLINLVLASIFIPLYIGLKVDSKALIFAIPIMIGLSLTGWFMWKKMIRLFYTYVCMTLIKIKEVEG